MGRRATKPVVTTLLVAVVLLGAIITVVVLRQEALIYFPRVYSETELQAAESVVFLDYVTDQGKQTAFLLPPRHSRPDSSLSLWVIFGGNASLALHWLGFARAIPDSHTAFLLVDYPGYGKCEGRPSPASIESASELALQCALEHPSMHSAHLRIAAFGHSLGAAAALQLASRTEVEHLLLLAPFTSMLDMARRTVGGPLAQFLRHRFDNRARLEDVLKKYPSTRVTIVHGTRDEVIPVVMGRELAALAPARIDYVELNDADHNALAVIYDQELYRIMLRLPAQPGTRDR